MNAMTSLATPVEEQQKTPSGLGCLVIVARQHGLHLTTDQLIHDNLLSGPEVSFADLIKCAAKAGLSAKTVELDWHGLTHLKKALPAIVRLKNGANMVLTRVEADEKNAFAVLQDPNANDGAPLVIDRLRFEGAWSGEVLLVKRNYDIADETQPFSLGLITALLFRERWVARDVLICAVILGFLGLSPIMFWRLLSDKVMTNHAYNTFWVLCGAMAVDHAVRGRLLLYPTDAGPFPDHQDRRQALDLCVRKGPEPADRFLRAHPDRPDLRMISTRSSRSGPSWSDNCSAPSSIPPF